MEKMLENLEESKSICIVAAIYEALNRRDAAAIQKILAPDLEWWFHGPPSHQFLMRLLTGKSHIGFHFDPQYISSVGSIVLSEGYDERQSIAWVHAWTVTNGVITQVREYFNTSLTVTKIETTDELITSCSSSRTFSSSSSRTFSSSSSRSSISSLYCPSIWESSLAGRIGKSVPGLLLAIQKYSSGCFVQPSHVYS